MPPLDSVADLLPFFVHFTLSRRTQLTRPNNVTTNFSYDNLSRLLSVLHQSGSTTLDGAAYAVDNAGNRTSRTPLPGTTATNYTYDAIYELLTAKVGTTTNESYTYDLVGNRLSSLGVSPYTNNTSNELTSTPTASYTYDYNGNTLTKVVGTNTTSYAWDYENRLSSVTLPGSGGTVTFKYDPFGRRIYKSSSAGTSVFAYDGDNITEETNSTGGVVARYTQTQNIDEPLAMLRSATTSYHQADGLGSVTSLSNGAGALAQTYTFDSFGKQTSSSGSLVNSFQYTARESDSETGLYYYRARYYDSSIGRFLSEDPVTFDGGSTDFYSYANNEPTFFIDPSGLAPDCPNCKIEVRCRGIEKAHLGASGFRHCDARVVDKNGVTHSLSAGPDPPEDIHGKLGGWDTPSPSGPFTGHVVYRKNKANCDVADCLVSKAAAYQASPATWPEYKYLGGPNSDTWLKGEFRACGIKLHIRWYGSPIFGLWPLL